MGKDRKLEDEEEVEYEDYEGEGEEGEDEEASDDEEEEEDEERPVAEPRKDAIYNSAALLEKLDDISWPKDLEWTQTLTLRYEEECEKIDANDDLAREMAFYTQGLDAANEAYKRLQALHLPFLRPEDYYAEMVKSDKHMLKIKDKLLSQQKQMEETDERRKARESKKFSKEVQAEKMKERAKQKKQDIESVKKWRKMRKNTDYAEGGDELPFEVDGNRSAGKSNKKSGRGGRSFVAPWDRSGGKNETDGKRGFASKRGGRGGRASRGGRGGSSKNREARDAKFGFGGRKGLKKRNTSDSFADAGRSRGRGGGKRQKV